MAIYKNIGLYPFIFVLIMTALSGCGNKAEKQTEINKNNTQSQNIVAEKTEEINEAKVNQASDEDKLCGWIDKSDIVVKLNFAEGVTKDTSYEAGFYFSPIISTMRLARQACDYRTGFNFSEFKNKGAAQVGVRGYTDSVRRQLANEPLSVVFDENGASSIGQYIEVQVNN